MKKTLSLSLLLSTLCSPIYAYYGFIHSHIQMADGAKIVGCLSPGTGSLHQFCLNYRTFELRGKYLAMIDLISSGTVSFFHKYVTWLTDATITFTAQCPNSAFHAYKTWVFTPQEGRFHRTDNCIFFEALVDCSGPEGGPNIRYQYVVTPSKSC